VIRSYRSKDTGKLFKREAVRRYPPDIVAIARRKLEILDAAERLEDLKVPPGNRLEKLLGDRMGKHAIRINDRWRSSFYWSEGDAYEVEMVDYH